jgi:hypothetical protein
MVHASVTLQTRAGSAGPERCSVGHVSLYRNMCSVGGLLCAPVNGWFVASALKCSRLHTSGVQNASCCHYARVLASTIWLDANVIAMYSVGFELVFFFFWLVKVPTLAPEACKTRDKTRLGVFSRADSDFT